MTRTKNILFVSIFICFYFKILNTMKTGKAKGINY